MVVTAQVTVSVKVACKTANTGVMQLPKQSTFVPLLVAPTGPQVTLISVPTDVTPQVQLRPGVNVLVDGPTTKTSVVEPTVTPTTIVTVVTVREVQPVAELS